MSLLALNKYFETLKCYNLEEELNFLQFGREEAPNSRGGSWPIGYFKPYDSTSCTSTALNTFTTVCSTTVVRK